MDGTAQTQLQSKGGTPTVTGDWVYYAEDKQSLSRIKTDGSENQQLLSDYEDYYLAESDVYYIQLTETEDESLFTLTLYQTENADTGAKEIVVVEKVVTAQLDGGYLYYQLGKGEKADLKRPLPRQSGWIRNRKSERHHDLAAGLCPGRLDVHPPIQRRALPHQA